jgi:hypothetical protein
MLAGRRVAVRHGPGRGLLGGVAVAATALLAIGTRPVLVVLPRAADVDAWAGVIRPWMRGAGLHVVAAHGALSMRRLARVDEGLERHAIDVLVASTAWAGARVPPVGAAIIITDDMCPEPDLVMLRDRYDDRIRLVTGPASHGRLRLAAGAAGLVPLTARFDPRVNLRVVDHRGRDEPDRVETAAGRRPERRLVVAVDAAACVAEAQRRRDTHAATAGQIAYYHDRLPATLRRVLEDLYATDQLTTLVAGSLLVHPAIPLDVSRVEAVGLPVTRLLAGESLGAGGQGGQTTVVDLRFNAEDVAAWAAAHDLRHPSRETLVRCYHYFRRLGREGTWTWPPGPIGSDVAIPHGLLEVALAIFLEAGVVSAEGGVGETTRYSLVDPSARIDLERSLRYREAVREQAAFADLRAWASGPAAAILADLAQP